MAANSLFDHFIQSNLRKNRSFSFKMLLYLTIFSIKKGRLKKIQEIYRRNFCQKIQRFCKKYVQKKNELNLKEERIMMDSRKFFIS